jgi:tetratricopeptide (TPR) repeat protein
MVSSHVPCKGCFPDRAIPLAFRGRVHFLMGNPHEGLADITRALELSPELPLVFRYVLVKIYRSLGRLTEALAELDAIQAVRPEEFLHGERADLLHALGQPQKAERTLQELDCLMRQRVEEVACQGVRVTVAVVWASSVLYEADSREDASCRVLLTFDPELSRQPQRLLEMARRLTALRTTQQSDPDLQYAVELMAAENANVFYERRRQLPRSISGGAVVYLADLRVYRRFLRGCFLQDKLLTCVAQPGEEGKLELLPVEGFVS